jgi:hypothetical protein
VGGDALERLGGAERDGDVPRRDVALADVDADEARAQIVDAALAEMTDAGDGSARATLHHRDGAALLDHARQPALQTLLLRSGGR